MIGERLWRTLNVLAFVVGVSPVLCGCEEDRPTRPSDYSALESRVDHQSRQIQTLQRKLEALQAPETNDNAYHYIRNSADNLNLSDLDCPHCKKLVYQIGREQSLWWPCPAKEGIDHHRAGAEHMTSCRVGTCPFCKERICVRAEDH